MEIKGREIPIGLCLSINDLKSLLGEPDGTHRNKLMRIYKYGEFQVQTYRDEVIRINRYSGDFSLDAGEDIIMVEYEDMSGRWLRQ